MGREAASPNQPRIEIGPDRCSSCGACVAVCPVACITLRDLTLVVDSQACTLCQRCVVACPTGALSARPTREWPDE